MPLRARRRFSPAALAAWLLLAATSCEESRSPTALVLPPVQPISYLAGPVATPQGLFVGEATVLSVSATLSVREEWTLDELRAYRVSAAGDSLERLGSLADDGDLLAGDEIAGDGRYGGRLAALSVGSAQTLYLRLLARASGSMGGEAQLWSAILPLPVAAPIGQGELDALFALLDEAEADWADLVAGGSSDAAAKAQVAAWLAVQSGIAEAFVSPDGNSLWARLATGLNAGVFLPRWTDGPVLGGSRRAPAVAARPAPPRVALARALPARPALPMAARADDDPDRVHSNQMLLLSPFHTWLESEGGDPSATIAAQLGVAECPHFPVLALRDGEADVAAFAGLAANGGVCLITHGTLLDTERICLLTGEQATLASVLDWYWDLCSSAAALALVSVDGEKRLGVLPAFFTRYCQGFPNSLVVLAACSSVRGETLPAVLGEAGVGTLIGFDDTVGLAFASGALTDFWTALLDGPGTAGAALDAVSPASDPGHAGAQFRLRGNRALYFGSGLSNGDFESGQLVGWSAAGDARVITQLGEALPQGGYMAIISTGLGSQTDVGSLSQTLCLPADADTLRLAWNLFSEEFLEWCGSINQDTFDIFVDVAGTRYPLFRRRIDELCDQVTPAGIAFDQQPSEDDAGVYTTGWRELAVGIAAYAGATVTLHLAVGDVGDSLYDTAVLLDGIAIETVGQP